MLDQHGIAAESALHRWHPIEEQRENPDVPVPQTEAGRQAGHQRLEDTQTAESPATGKAQCHVRVELGSHHHAVMLARTLENEGRAVVRCWKFLIAGAGHQDQARELAAQIRQQAPPDTTVIAGQAGVGSPFMPSRPHGAANAHRRHRHAAPAAPGPATWPATNKFPIVN